MRYREGNRIDDVGNNEYVLESSFIAVEGGVEYKSLLVDVPEIHIAQNKSSKSVSVNVEKLLRLKKR